MIRGDVVRLSNGGTHGHISVISVTRAGRLCMVIWQNPGGINSPDALRYSWEREEDLVYAHN